MSAIEPSPIAYFAFARPEHTARSLRSLAANEGAARHPLYIFADAARDATRRKDVDAVREILSQVSGFREIHRTYREQALGCAESVIDGISTVLARHDQVVVVEDDLLLSPYFLRFVDSALSTYRDRGEVFSVSAGGAPRHELELPDDYTEDVFLAPRLSPWGWGTWSDRWTQVDWRISDYERFRRSPTLRYRLAQGGNDLEQMLALQMRGRIDAWDIRFNYHQIMSGRYSLHARRPYVRNMGMDGTGTHSRTSDRHEVHLDEALREPPLPPDVQPDPRVVRAMRRYHDGPWVSYVLGLIPGVRPAVAATKKRLGIAGPILGR